MLIFPNGKAQPPKVVGSWPGDRDVVWWLKWRQSNDQCDTGFVTKSMSESHSLQQNNGLKPE